MILKRRIKTLISIIKLNLIIIIFKLSNPNSKIIFFYHPRKLLTFIHTDYIKDLFNQFEGKYLTLYGHGVDQLFEKNHFFILQGYLKWIFNVDLFMSNNVCEVFTKNSIKIYMHHDIFDTPLTNVQKEKEFSNRLIKYDYIFLSSEVSLKQFSNLFEKNEKNQPIMKVVGYAKLDFIIKNSKSNLSKKNQLIIAPTNFYAWPDLEITRHLKRSGRLWIRIFPDVPVTKKPAEVRMGKGKGSVEFWACRVKPGRIMFEVDGVPLNEAKKAMELAAAKLPIKCKFIGREL